MTSGQPLMMRVTPDKYVNADADAVVAWSTSLRVQMQAQTHSIRVCAGAAATPARAGSSASSARGSRSSSPAR